MDLANLIPSFGNAATTIVAFLLALIPIIFVHELGHYLVGRWSGIRADVFSIGAGPVLWSRRDRRGTSWQIAAFPIGGYVRFHGDANAASGTADEAAMSTMDAAERRATLHGAPLWARAATVAAGPVTNFIFSAVVFTLLALWAGTAAEPLTVAATDPIPGAENTLRPGDVVLAIAGEKTPPLAEFSDFIAKLPDASPLAWTVERGGETITVEAPHPSPPTVSSVMLKSAAADAGLEPGDFITSANGKPIATFTDLQDIVSEGGGAPITLGIERGGKSLEVSLTPRRRDLPSADGGFETRWLIGIQSAGLWFEPATITPPLTEAIGDGLGRVKMIVVSSLSALGLMALGDISSCNLGGVITIAQSSGQAASFGLAAFIGFVALLSTAIGLINLFPIPVLDGGHLMFHAWEAVTRRPPSERVLSALTLAGLVLVIALMLLGIANDLFC